MVTNHGSEPLRLILVWVGIVVTKYSSDKEYSVLSFRSEADVFKLIFVYCV